MYKSDLETMLAFVEHYIACNSHESKKRNQTDVANGVTKGCTRGTGKAA